MGEDKGQEKKVAAPLLKAYLCSVPTNPPHLPAWPTWAGWAVFLVTGIPLMAKANGGCLGLGLAAILGVGATYLFQRPYRAKNDSQRADERLFAAVRKLKSASDHATLAKRLPPDVVRALERAVAAFNTSVARLNADDPANAVIQEGPMRQALHACFLASLSVFREDTHSKKEWEAVLDNKAHIGEIVDTIDNQTARIRDSLGSNSERLAALRELEMIEPYEALRDRSSG